MAHFILCVSYHNKKKIHVKKKKRQKFVGFKQLDNLRRRKETAHILRAPQNICPRHSLLATRLVDIGGSTAAAGVTGWCHRCASSETAQGPELGI